jgi:hypothetical protein
MWKKVSKKPSWQSPKYRAAKRWVAGLRCYVAWPPRERWTNCENSIDNADVPFLVSMPKTDYAHLDNKTADQKDAIVFWYIRSRIVRTERYTAISRPRTFLPRNYRRSEPAVTDIKRRVDFLDPAFMHW